MAIELLGEFELDTDKLVGRGAWGDVYLGRQLSLNRPVAIKILKNELTADADFIKRFQRESECLAKLTDEHIIQVYSAGEHKGSYYFAMELVHGQPLSKFMERGRHFSIKEIVYVAEAVARAMKTAWESPAKIVHRDIKPSNIMISYSSLVAAAAKERNVSESVAMLDANILEGKIKVMDFGLAKLTESDKEATMAGTVIGTPKYISPEQGEGNPVDIRSDIYSLGIVVYEMATGRIPFTASTAVSLIRHHIYDTAVAPSQYNPDVPPGLEKIIMRCIQKDPNQRYATPNELLADIETFRLQQSQFYAAPAGRMEAPERPTAPTVTAQRSKRNVLIYGGIGGLVIIAGLLVFLLVGRPQAPQTPATPPETPPASSTPAQSGIMDPEYKKVLAQAKRFIESNMLKGANDAINKLRKYKGSEADVRELTSQLAPLYYQQGIDYDAKDDYEKAIASYTKAIELKPKYTDAYLNRGVAYRKKGDNKQAITDYSKAIEFNPQDTLAYFDRALVYSDIGNTDLAIADYEKTVELDPRYTDAWNNLGVLYYNKSDNDRAIPKYIMAIKLNPQYALAYYNLGLAYDSKGDTEGALTNYSKSIELDPSYVKAYFYRGELYRKKGEKDAALADYTVVIDLDPKYTEAYFNRGLIYYEKSEFDLAISNYTVVIKRVPTSADAYFNRGRTYQAQSKIEEARNDFKKALELDPNYQKAKEALDELEKSQSPEENK